MAVLEISVQTYQALKGRRHREAITVIVVVVVVVVVFLVVVRVRGIGAPERIIDSCTCLFGIRLKHKVLSFFFLLSSFFFLLSSSRGPHFF